MRGVPPSVPVREPDVPPRAPLRCIVPHRVEVLQGEGVVEEADAGADGGARSRRWGGRRGGARSSRRSSSHPGVQPLSPRRTREGRSGGTRKKPTRARGRVERGGRPRGRAAAGEDGGWSRRTRWPRSRAAPPCRRSGRAAGAAPAPQARPPSTRAGEGEGAQRRSGRSAGAVARRKSEVAHAQLGARAGRRGCCRCRRRPAPARSRPSASRAAWVPGSAAATGPNSGASPKRKRLGVSRHRVLPLHPRRPAGRSSGRGGAVPKSLRPGGVVVVALVASPRGARGGCRASPRRRWGGRAGCRAAGGRARPPRPSRCGRPGGRGATARAPARRSARRAACPRRRPSRRCRTPTSARAAGRAAAAARPAPGTGPSTRL